jgi:hypothetical protein
MKRFSALLLLSAASITGAYAQNAQTPQSAAAAIEAASAIAEGDYVGTVQQQGGKRSSSDLKMTIRDVTPDGRVTATVAATHPRRICAKRLPMNGIVLPEGLMRLTVDDGVPQGCERVYHLKVTSGGALSGNFVNGRNAPKQAVTQ